MGPNDFRDIMLGYLYFPHGNWPPCWFLRAYNFICWRGRGDRGTSPCQMFSKLVYPKQRYCDFSIFQMAAATILDFWNRKILLAIGVQWIEMHQHANFHQNWSIGCDDIKIFLFFKMAAVRHLGFVWGIFRPPTVSICKICLWSMQ